MAPTSISPLNLALGHLETAERELHAQLAAAEKTADTIRLELGATLEAIAGLRKINGGRAPAPPPIDRPRPARRQVPPMRNAGPVAALQKGHAGMAASQARARALLLFLVDGPKTAFDLRAALPRPADATEQQHKASVSNALTRMKGEGLVSPRADGWTLTAKGRKAAAAPAAKEEP